MIREWRQRRRDAAIARLQAAHAALATMSPWARLGVYIAGGILFAAGIGMSGFFLSQLAVAFGIQAPFSYLLPAALDAGAVVGVFMWVTGTGEIELFGRRTARLLFGLSILGNGLERALTFAPGQTSLDRTVALARALSFRAGVDPVIAVATWFNLLVSIGLGVVFPILAYQMGHAIILSRKSADAPVRGKAKAPQPQVPQHEGPMRKLARKATDTVPALAAAPVAAAATPRLEVHVPAETAAETTREVPRVPAASGTPTATERADAFILREWDRGKTVTGADVDRYCGTNPRNGLGRKRLAAMRDQYPGREPGSGNGNPAGDSGAADDYRSNGHAVSELVTAGSGER